MTSITITALGAGGGSGSFDPSNDGGSGVGESGTFAVAPGTALDVIVGQAGGSSMDGGGGGGGTYVYGATNPAPADPLIAAGGGGGGGVLGVGIDGSTSTSGTAAGDGGCGGSGGGGGCTSVNLDAGGGGGYNSGGDGVGGLGEGGQSALDGALGGSGVASDNAYGGFGGGGGGGTDGGGGGGGYSGGGGGGGLPPYGGGGGGSYNAGTNTSTSAGASPGDDGSVTITYATPTACGAPVASGDNEVVTCSYTDGDQVWTVPPGVTSATFDAEGAAGGTIEVATLNAAAPTGGAGGAATGVFTVTPGTSYTIQVGGMGASNSGCYGYSGGFGGGGAGGNAPSQPCAAPGAGGGGASAVFAGGSPLVVGGGGGGAANCDTANGGAGGGSSGDVGASCSGGSGGPPGTESGGGVGIDGGGNGGPGSGGVGAVGAGEIPDGGGGGGGYYGGAGGAPNGGGGGGSGFVDSSAISSNMETGVQTGNGVVTITYANPVATTTIASTPNATSVTLGTTPPTLTDSATLSGGNAPTGTITFTLYNPSDVLVDTEYATVDGNGTYATPDGYTLPTSGTVTGTYQWDASYSGDLFNTTSSDNNDPAEQVVVNGATPTLTSIPSATSITLSKTAPTLKDTATLSGGYYPTGTITFTLFYDGGATPIDTETVTANGNGVYTTPTGYKLANTSIEVTGTYQWDVTYSGDGNNNGYSDLNDPAEVVTVTAAGQLGFGQGWYTPSAGVGQTGFGFVVAKASKSGDWGQLNVLTPNKWWYQGNVTSFVVTGPTQAKLSGTGNLFSWNSSLNRGRGGWTLVKSNVAYSAIANATTKTVVASFGITINYAATGLPNSSPVTLSRGGIFIS